MTETKALHTEREGGRPDKRVFLGLNAQWRSWSGVVSRPIRPFIHSFISTGQAGCRAPEVACGKAGPLLVGRRPCTARPRRGDDAPLRKEGDSPGLRSSVSVFTQAWDSGTRESEPAGDPVCRGRQPVTARGGPAAALTDAGFPRR